MNAEVRTARRELHEETLARDERDRRHLARVRVRKRWRGAAATALAVAALFVALVAASGKAEAKPQMINHPTNSPPGIGVMKEVPPPVIPPWIVHVGPVVLVLW